VALRQTAAVWTDELEVSDDPSAAAWIAPRLVGEFGAVTLAVPSGYPAYVRICHPATDTAAALVSWSAVAKETGREVHALMQWHAVVGSPDHVNFRGSLWDGNDPERGNLVPEVLGPLCELLGEHTADARHCFFCLWEGWGWIDGRGVWVMRIDDTANATRASEVPVQPGFSPEELSRRRVKLPHRDYILLEGSLSAALQIGHWPGPDWFCPQSPNLFWPADRAWCVASEIDFDSTLLGGTAELVEAVLEDPTFDAWPVGPDDSLAYDADHVNKVP
jgi:hypothetical protein